MSNKGVPKSLTHRRKLAATKKLQWADLATRDRWSKFGKFGRLYRVELLRFKEMQNRVKGGAAPSSAWPRTRQGFECFIKDLGPIPSGMICPTIGRVNHSKGYRKGNCDWESKSMNSRKNMLRMNLRHPKRREWRSIAARKTRQRWASSAYRLRMSKAMKVGWARWRKEKGEWTMNPGPWKTGREDMQSYTGDGKTAFTNIYNLKHEVVGRAEGRRNKAYARLMAASPEMRDLLKRAEQFCRARTGGGILAGEMRRLEQRIIKGGEMPSEKKKKEEPKHVLVGKTLVIEDEGIFARCVCGWSSRARISSFSASLAFAEHVENADEG